MHDAGQVYNIGHMSIERTGAATVHRIYYFAAALLLLLLLGTSIPGLFWDGTYEGFIAPLHLAESQGQDLTTLFVGIPLLVIAVLLTLKRSAKGPVLWAGAAGYFLYVYLIYAYGGVYNFLFPAYLAVCGISLFTMIGLLRAVDADDFASRIGQGMPTRVLAVFFFVVALLLTVMWGVMAIDAISSGKTADANVIIVTDFVIVIPAYVLTGVALLRRQVLGVVVSGVLLVQAVTLGLSIVAGQVVAYIKGIEPVWGLGIFFLVFTAIACWLSCKYLRNIGR